MVQTRKQANGEAQAVLPTAPTPIINAAPLTPAPVTPKKRGKKGPSSKRSTPVKATPKKTSSKKKSPRSIVKNSSTVPRREDDLDEGNAAEDRLITKKSKSPAIKKGGFEKKPQNPTNTSSNGNAFQKGDTNHAELVKQKGQATLLVKRKKRGTRDDTTDDEDVPEALEKGKAIAKGPKKPPRRSDPTGNETDPDRTETDEDLERLQKHYDKRKRKQTGGPESSEPPQKKTKRSTKESATRNAATGKDDTNAASQESVPVNGAPKRVAAAAAKRAAKVSNPQAEPVISTRRSARISGNPITSASGDEDWGGRPLKGQFKNRVKTPEIPENKIGLDENEIFDPRFPTEEAKPVKATKRTRNGGAFSRKAKQRTSTWEANEASLSVWERTTIEGLTAQLIVPTASRSSNKPSTVDDSLQVRFQQRSRENCGHDITELGIEDSEAQMPTLNNTIHPIWAFRNFTFSGEPSEKDTIQDRRAYQAIAPALRLASHWIEEQEFVKFWDALWSGGLSHNEKIGAVKISAKGPGDVYGETPFHELKIARYKGPGQQKAASMMQELAELESLEWRFEPTAVKYVGLSTTTGQVSTLHDWFERDILSDSSPPPDSIRTTSERLRVLFLFAVHLCRQLVHQVYHHNWARFSGEAAPPHISKVFFEIAPGTFDYLEVSWDTFMFTGSVVKVNPHQCVEVDCPDGLAIALGRRAAEWKSSPSPKTFAALRMRWINDLFQDTFWSQKDSSSYFPRLPDGDSPYCAAGPFT